MVGGVGMRRRRHLAYCLLGKKCGTPREAIRYLSLFAAASPSRVNTSWTKGVSTNHFWNT
jgi:hypothetical protein